MTTAMENHTNPLAPLSDLGAPTFDRLQRLRYQGINLTDRALKPKYFYLEPEYKRQRRKEERLGGHAG